MPEAKKPTRPAKVAQPNSLAWKEPEKSPAQRWEWEGDPPSVTEAMDALSSLPLVWGVATVDYAAHVLPMSQAQTIYLDDNGNRVPSKRMSKAQSVIVIWRLYMQVAGRLAMLNQALLLNDWEADFEPDPTTGYIDGKGLPAFVGQKETVYREYLVLRRPVNGDRGQGFYEFGRRPGMASLKSSDRVPPWEKLETAARGRALGAWGFGVLPGSGIASLEEMELAQYPDLVIEGEPEPVRDRETVEHDLFLDLGQYRVVRNRSVEEANAYLITVAYEVSGKKLQVVEDRVDISPLTDPQAELVRRRLASDLSTLRTEASPL